MIIFIKLKGKNDLKDLANSVNEEQDVDLQISHIREYLLYYWDGDIDEVSVTMDSMT